MSCALSPHDGGASLAVGGENAAALVFDLRGAHLVAHRLTAAAGCFDKGDAVPCVSYNLAAPHALYCASGRVVTAWDVRRLPGAADARVRVGCVAGAAKSAPPTHPAEHGVYDDDDDAKDANDATRVWTRVSVERDQSSSISGAIDTYAHNADEINHFVIDAVGACLYAADDECEVTVVDVAKNKRLKTLRFDGHESFVSCVALRGHKPREVVSGGLDARVCVWDRDKAAAVRRWSVNELVAAADAAEAEASAAEAFSQTENFLEEGGANARETNARQTRQQTNIRDRDPSRMMNPPFVHCVATWACARAPTHAHTRRLAAAACGDGTVALVDLDAPKSDASGAKKKKKKNTSNSRPGGAPTRVDALGGLPAVFLGRGARGGAHASAASHVAFPGWGDGDVVVSGGNDRAIKAWRWNDVERAPPSTARHGAKVNWIAHAETREACPGGGHVFVADTSETVAVYDANASFA